tara:strand:- start:2507 stop:4624 length:2118 start_codon:yes stop_codon:yes gene_type:complete
MKLKLNLWICITVLLAVSILAPHNDAHVSEIKQPTQFEKDMAGLGITVTNCQGCSFDGSNTITLAPGANIKNVPQGIRVQVAGGKVDLDDGSEVSGQGTLTTGVSKSKLHRGKLKYKRKSKSSIDFTEAEVDYADAQIKGDGKIIEGNLHLDNAELKVGTLQHRISDAAVTEIHPASDTISFQAGKSGSALGTAQDNIIIEREREFLLVGSKDGINSVFVRAKPGLDLDLSDPPSFKIQGKPTIRILDHSNEYKDTSVVRPLKLNLNGITHLVSGEFEINKGQLSIRAVPGSRKIHLIDGVNIAANKNVNIFFDDQPHSGNYLSLGDSLSAGGKGFSIGLSSGTKGGLDPHIFPEDFVLISKYASEMEDASSPSRLIIKVNDGQVILDPKVKNIYSSGSVYITNGINRITYSRQNGKQIYTNRFIGCVAESCSSYGYTMTDGGLIDFDKRIGTIPHKNKPIEQTLVFQGTPLNLLLNEENLYVAHYTGGSAAIGIVDRLGYDPGTLDSEDRKTYNALVNAEPGHQAALFFVDGELWVTEATGSQTVVVPVEESLFADGKFSALFEVVDDQGSPVSSASALQMSRKLAAGEYDYDPKTEARHCGEVAADIATGCLQASKGQTFKPRVTMRHWKGDMTRGFIAKMGHQKFIIDEAPSPRAVSESGNVRLIAEKDPEGQIYVHPKVQPGRPIGPQISLNPSGFVTPIN